MSSSHFLLPDVGEGLTEAEIVSWKVAPGDVIRVNQVIVDIETAKSLVELPSPFEGVVSSLLVAEGQTVEVGTPIISVEMSDNTPSSSDTPAPAEVSDTVPVAESAAVAESDGSDGSGGAVLVGYGSSGHVPSRRRKSLARPVASPPPVSAPVESVHGPETSVRTKPPVRKLAKDLGVDLAEVTPTGRGGDVTREDILREHGQRGGTLAPKNSDEDHPREERIPVKGVRKVIAAAMTASAFTAPHVSLFVEVDATRTMEFVSRLKKSSDYADTKVSPLLIVAKALLWAARRNPGVNAEWTDAEIIVRHYVNLGIAAATPRGLIVPNIKEAQSLTLRELAGALDQLTQRARAGKTQPTEMAGGTITITNIGVFGMDTGTPILNPGESGIVALGTIKQKPWVIDGEIRPRYVTTLGASFDHRVVDGDVASRFLADIATIVEEPALLLD